MRRFHSKRAVDGAQRRRKFWHFGPSFLARFLDILRFRNEPNFLSEILKAQFLSSEILKDHFLKKPVSYVREPTVTSSSMIVQHEDQ